ncbi:MAG: ABC transporter permease, partial [Oscillospiraceae bacterium]|nr:ABC transporter permease [Oscillospiraceae bacterium]
MIKNLIGSFQNFYRYRFLLQNLIQRDIKVKYRRSTLGILWSVLNPLLMMFVLTMVFSYFFRFDIENYPV